MSEYEEDYMPVICESCRRTFDLNDGYGSEKWYPDTVICEQCGKLEEQEIELEDEVENCQNELSDAEWTIKEMGRELERLKVKQDDLQQKIELKRTHND